jgi:hypothetical protein
MSAVAFESPHPQPDLDAVREALILVLRLLEDGPARADKLLKATALNGWGPEWTTLTHMAVRDKLIERANEATGTARVDTVVWRITPRGRRSLEQLEGRQWL